MSNTYTKPRLTTEQVEKFSREGYLLPKEPVFSQSEFAALRAHFEEKIANLPSDVRPESMDVPHFMDTELFRWAMSDAVLDLVEPIIGSDIALFSTHFICKPKGDGKRVPWHEDSAYWKSMVAWSDDAKAPTEIVTVWLAVDPSTLVNGCMKVIPRTHAEGQKGFSDYVDVDTAKNVFHLEIDPVQRREELAVPCILEAGQCSLHDARLMHGSEPNTSDIRRCGYTMRFMGTNVKLNPEVETYHHIYLARGKDKAGNNYADPTKTIPMSLKIESNEYRWIENWITIPESPLGKANGRTHGVTVLKNGDVVIFHQADLAILFYSPDGVLLKKWGNFPGAHGLTLVEEGGRELLWLVDEQTKSVVKTTLDGEVLMSLPQPPHPEYASGNYIPTWAAVAEERFGGNGDIWVTDGYGSHLVHRFNRSGAYLGTLDGSEGAGRFSCPHGLALDTRRSEAEFYIADRGNSRFQVYGMDGTYRRSFGADFLHSPDVSARMGDKLIVPELVAGITVLDAGDHLVARLGFQSGADSQQGWPNNREWVCEGKFNSPHSAAADAHGNIYIVEWITGGRVTKLERMVK